MDIYANVSQTVVMGRLQHDQNSHRHEHFDANKFDIMSCSTVTKTQSSRRLKHMQNTWLEGSLNFALSLRFSHRRKITGMMRTKLGNKAGTSLEH